MSYLWSFATFDANRLLALFADPSGAATARLVELTAWEGAGFDDPVHAADVAARFAGSGLSYEGLDARDARVADQLVMVMFSPEGFEPDLAVEYLSAEGVHPLEINELLARVPDARLLPVLILGRRAGQLLDRGRKLLRTGRDLFGRLSPAAAATQLVGDGREALGGDLSLFERLGLLLNGGLRLVRPCRLFLRRRGDLLGAPLSFDRRAFALERCRPPARQRSLGAAELPGRSASGRQRFDHRLEARLRWRAARRVG